jgi:hypothetical protein
MLFVCGAMRRAMSLSRSGICPAACNLRVWRRIPYASWGWVELRSVGLGLCTCLGINGCGLGQVLLIHSCVLLASVSRAPWDWLNRPNRCDVTTTLVMRSLQSIRSVLGLLPKHASRVSAERICRKRGHYLVDAGLMAGARRTPRADSLVGLGTRQGPPCGRFAPSPRQRSGGWKVQSDPSGVLFREFRRLHLRNFRQSYHSRQLGRLRLL